MGITYKRPTQPLFFSRSVLEIADLVRRDTDSILLLVVIYGLFLPVLFLGLLPAMFVLDLVVLPFMYLGGFRVRR